MLHINKIKIGNSVYNIVPELGGGLQLGTTASNAHKLYVNIGTATFTSNISIDDPGLYINTRGFVIDTGKFTAFLETLGFKRG